MARDPVAEMRAILGESRRAILGGEFGVLEALGKRCEDLAAEIRDPAMLAALRDSAAHNQRLVKAALQGLADGRHRVDAARAAASGFDSYDGRGAAERVAAPGGIRLERRS